MQITLDSLKLITNEYPLATPENIQVRFEELCKLKGLDPLNYKAVGGDRVVLAGYVSYLKVYHVDQLPLHTSDNKSPEFTFTFNEEVCNKWGLDPNADRSVKRSIYCNKLLWTTGKEHLTTLNDKQYLNALRGIEDQLMIKYGIDKESWVNKLKNAEPVTGLFSNCRVFEKYSNMLTDLFKKEGLFSE